MAEVAEAMSKRGAGEKSLSFFMQTAHDSPVQIMFQVKIKQYGPQRLSGTHLQVDEAG